MPTVLQTVTTGGTSTNADLALRLKLQISDKIYKKGPALAPLTWISRMNRKKAIGRQEFNILESEPLPRFTNTTTTGTGTSVVVTSGHGSYFRPQDVVKVPRTGEEMLVSSIATDTLTVVRGYGTTAATALVSGDELMIIGNALSEGSAAVASRTVKTSSRTNYLQFFSRTTGLTEIRSNTEEWGENEEDRQIKEARYEIMRDIEGAHLFGEPLADIQGSSPIDGSLVYTRYKTGGLKYWIDTGASANVLDAGGVLSQQEFWDWAEPMYRNSPTDESDGTKRLMLFGGQKAISVINQWALRPVQTAPETKKFGMRLDEYYTPFGRFLLHNHYMMSESTEYQDYLFAVNPDFVEFRYLNKMDITLKQNIQANDEHLVKHELYTVCGLWLTLPSTMGYIKNVNLPG
jgi:hypothetical protein